MNYPLYNKKKSKNPYEFRNFYSSVTGAAIYHFPWRRSIDILKSLKKGIYGYHF